MDNKILVLVCAVIIILEKLAEGGQDSGIQKNFNCAQKVLI